MGSLGLLVKNWIKVLKPKWLRIPPLLPLTNLNKWIPRLRALLLTRVSLRHIKIPSSAFQGLTPLVFSPLKDAFLNYVLTVCPFPFFLLSFPSSFLYFNFSSFSPFGTLVVFALTQGQEPKWLPFQRVELMENWSFGMHWRLDWPV